MLLIKPGHMSGNFPKSLPQLRAMEQSCGHCRAVGDRACRKARLPASTCQLQASHINQVLKVCISHPSAFFINFTIQKRGEKKKEHYYIGPLVYLSIIEVDVISSILHFFF